MHTAPILVVDEADLAFDMGFIEEIDGFASQMPEKLEMYVFLQQSRKNFSRFKEIYGSASAHPYE